MKNEHKMKNDDLMIKNFLRLFKLSIITINHLLKKHVSFFAKTSAQPQVHV